MKKRFGRDKFFKRIYKQYYINVLNRTKDILYSETSDDITSCVQDTFIKAWDNIELLKEHENVAGWLVVTAKNVAMDFNKKYLLRQNYIINNKILDEITDEEDFDEKIASESAAEKILSCLSQDERKLYDLKHVAELSNEEIGKILGITPNAVASRNKRLTEKLRKIYVSQK